MANKVKDTRLEEKEEMVIHGTILADEFRDRTTGKLIDEESEENKWVEKVSKKLRVDNGDIEVDDALVIKDSDDGKVAIYTDEDTNGVKRVAVNGLVSNGDVEVNGNLAVGNAITGKTIEQSEANYSANIDTFCNIGSGTAEVIFCRVQQLNKSLHIIFVGKITNNTKETISAYSTTVIPITLPESIAEKILDYTGVSAKESTSNAAISSVYATSIRSTAVDMSQVNTDVYMFVRNVQSANVIGVSFNRSSSIQITAGSTTYFEGRLELDLI